MSNPKAYKDMQDMIQDPGYPALLEEALRNPKGKASEQLVKKAMKFINLSASKVPWGPRERALEMTFYMAMHRADGAANIFYSAAPDDVHSILSILYSDAYKGPTAFPAKPPDAFFQALRAPRDNERDVGGFDMREDTLQTLAGRNPIATTLNFQHVKENLRDNLIGLSSTRKKNEPIDSDKRVKGVYGVNLRNRDVNETNKRTQHHEHGQTQGGLAPAFLADVASEPELRKLAMRALDTQICAELPLEYHALYEIQKLLHVAARRDVSHTIPEPPACNADESGAEYEARLQSEWLPPFLHHARMTVMNKHIHEHMETCVRETKPGKKPDEGCRLDAFYPHDIDETRVVELRLLKPNAVPSDQVGLSIRCPCCYAGGALSDPKLSPEQRADALIAADSKHELFHTAHDPSSLDACGGPDHRVLVVDMRRRLMPAIKAADDERPEVHDDRFNNNGSENAHAKLLQQVAREERRTLEFPEGPEGDEAARVCLKRLLAPGEKLRELLEKDENRSHRQRVEGLLTLPRDCYTVDEDVDRIQASERKRVDELRSLLRKLVCPDMVCHNRRIADHCLVVSGCLGSNAVPYSLGAGAGSKATSMYNVRTMRLESTNCSIEHLR